VVPPLNHYWGAIIAFVIGVVYVLTHRQWAISYAKTLIPKLMLAAEKKCEELLLKDGADKKDWVISNGYDLLPSPVRMVISKPFFSFLVQQLFDEAMAFAKAHLADNQTQQSVAPASDTSTNTQQQVGSQQ
jgi:hypothetical protein